MTSHNEVRTIELGFEDLGPGHRGPNKALASSALAMRQMVDPPLRVLSSVIRFPFGGADDAETEKPDSGWSMDCSSM